MTRHLSLRVFLLFALALVTGCGPRWTILAQAQPDPLLGAKAFYIEPIHFDPPIVGDKTEAEYLADKSPDQRDSWLTDKSDTSTRYMATLIGSFPGVQFATGPAPGVFIVRPIVSFIEPGFYAGIAAAPTVLRMRVVVLTSQGGLVDDFLVPSVIGASMVYASSGSRMRLAGEDLGRVTADYLKLRVFPPT
jgi:hypothetical protein